MTAVQQTPDAVERENNDDTGTNPSEYEIQLGRGLCENYPRYSLLFC